MTTKVTWLQKIQPKWITITKAVYLAHQRPVCNSVSPLIFFLLRYEYFFTNVQL